jgi:hypothetical protein
VRLFFICIFQIYSQNEIFIKMTTHLNYTFIQIIKH